MSERRCGWRSWRVRVGRGWRTAGSTTAALVLATSIGLPPESASAQQVEQPGAAASIDQVYDAIGVDAVGADYVILVDTSGSMADRYAAVQVAVREFVTALAPEDRVILVPFDEKVHDPWIGRVGRSPGQVAEKLPDSATGRNTDLGRAIEWAVDELAKPDAAPTATVVLFTDGEHRPRQDSEYPSDNGFAWDELRDRVAALRKDALRAYAVPLRTGETGAANLAAVFRGRTEVLHGDLDGLVDRLARPKAESRAAKARALLGDDPDQPVRVEWPGDLERLLDGRTHTTRVVLRSTTTYLPLVVSELTASASDGSLRARVPGADMTLPAGQHREVPLTVQWVRGERSAWPRDTRQIAAAVTLHGKVSSPWGDALREHLDVMVATDLNGARTEVMASMNYGRPGEWSGGVLLAILVLAAGALWLHRRANPRLFGLLSAQSLTGGDCGSVVLRGRAMTMPHRRLAVPGRGTVRARRSAPATRSRGVALEIMYYPENRPERAITQFLQQDQEKVINGVRFRWTASSRTGGGSAADGGTGRRAAANSRDRPVSPDEVARAGRRDIDERRSTDGAPAAPTRRPRLRVKTSYPDATDYPGPLDEDRGHPDGEV